MPTRNLKLMASKRSLIYDFDDWWHQATTAWDTPFLIGRLLWRHYQILSIEISVFIDTMQTSPLLGTYFFRQSTGQWWILASLLIIHPCWAEVSNQKQPPGRQRQSSLCSIVSNLLLAKYLQHQLWRPPWVVCPRLWQLWYKRKNREEAWKGMTLHSLSTYLNRISFPFQPTAKNVFYCLLYSRNNPNEANRRQVRMLPIPIIKMLTFSSVVLIFLL